MIALLLSLVLWLGGTVYEDGSAVLPIGGCVLIVPAFDSPGDAVTFTCEEIR